MSRTCDICGKHTITGNKVSHAKNHTRRTWKPNLVKIKTEIKGTTMTLKFAPGALKVTTLRKRSSFYVFWSKNPLVELGFYV